ncbi:CocE/NonD hydrolase [Niveomyces insectorum RCEF 264]|uniref:CocE/NonD hydrolase n=1 Tax=Niveomyces insectorum RCEF 264 TaxID=1081102 RepID=A0A167SMJ0_9HYPO|nr:CocE/NonD hydrolase [Niveomyces insectorum RCEF 264]
MASKMVVDRDVPITMDDGVVLRADVYRPASGQHPVLMTYGPYGKGVPWRDAYRLSWQAMVAQHPDMLPGSSREYMVWETPDPETWVPWGYVCVRVDSRGAGRSPGHLDIWAPRESRDYYACIEWAAAQPWCTGKVGLSGISYYAANQWMVASLQPPHLAAMVPWEGFADSYRDQARHGGILSNDFVDVWFPRQIVSVQHGNPHTITDPWLGERASGPATLSDAERAQNRSDAGQDRLRRPLDGDWYRARSADWARVTVPFLSCASWAGYGLHPRGNFEAFTQAASTQKWLSCHPGKHEEWYYLPEGVNLQKRFLDHFLKGIDNGWDREPAVIMRERRPFSHEFPVRHETAWPLLKTAWTKLYFGAAEDGSSPALAWDPSGASATTSFAALDAGITLLSAPLENDVEITGPLAAKIFASSSTTDMDLFVTLQAFSPDGREVDFQGTVDPHTPLAQGWLRASHRKLDASKTLPYRPYHSHDEIQPLAPGTTYELDVEIWPTHIILPAGYRLALHIGGKDFERPATPGEAQGAWKSRGSGPFLHTHPLDRPADVYGGTSTIYYGGKTPSFLLLPIIKA